MSTKARKSALVGRGGHTRLMSLLAIRMMFHDRAKLIGTLLGVVFATVLVNQQLGVFLGLLGKNTMFVDNAGADLWVVPPSTQTLQGGTPISLYTLNQARVAPGVAWAEPLLFGAAIMQRPDGGSEAVTLVGTNLTHLAGGPWNLVAGDVEALRYPDTVIFEDSQREKLGGLNLGSERELSGHRVIVGGFTWGLNPFGPPYAFTRLETAREIIHTPEDQTTFVLIRLQSGADIGAVQRDLAARLPNALILTRQQFHDSITWYLIRAQLGISFGTSTAFAVIVGFVIVSLSMFSAVVDNVREFGTLKATGATTFDLAKLLFVQALSYAFLGATIGLFLVTRMSEGIRSPNLSLVLPPELFVGTYALMGLLCVFASLLALWRVRNVEPGMVFR